MATTIEASAFERATDRILEFLTPAQVRQLVEFCGDAQLEARIEELANKSNEGELTELERSEYEGYVQANKFIATFQAMARKRLADFEVGRMDEATRRSVRERAQHRCECCLLAQSLSPIARLQMEHVVPRKHGGSDNLDNLALACIDCNLHEGSNVASFDPETGLLTALFHPRKDEWNELFEWMGPIIVGKSPVGRATVATLKMNSEDQIQLRNRTF